MPVMEEIDAPVQPQTPSATDESELNQVSWLSSVRVCGGIGLGLGIALIAGGLLYTHFAGRVTTDDAQVDGHIAPVAAKIAGNVEEVLAEDNQLVKAGQLLFRLDGRDYEVKVAQAEAALALAESQARAAQAGVPLVDHSTASQKESAEAQVAAAEAELSRAKTVYEISSGSELAYAEAQLEAAKAAEEKAKADLARMDPLVKKQEISRIQYDAYLAAARMTESQSKAAREKVSSTRLNAENSRASWAAAEAKLWQAKAQLAQARATRGQLDIQVSQAKSSISRFLKPGRLMRSSNRLGLT